MSRVLFTSLVPGDVFEFQGIKYVKTKPRQGQEVNALNLKNCSDVFFLSHETIVEKLNENLTTTQKPLPHIEDLPVGTYYTYYARDCVMFKPHIYGDLVSEFKNHHCVVDLTKNEVRKVFRFDKSDCYILSQEEAFNLAKELSKK